MFRNSCLLCVLKAAPRHCRHCYCHQLLSGTRNLCYGGASRAGPRGSSEGRSDMIRVCVCVPTAFVFCHLYWVRFLPSFAIMMYGREGLDVEPTVIIVRLRFFSCEDLCLCQTESLLLASCSTANFLTTYSHCRPWSPEVKLTGRRAVWLPLVATVLYYVVHILVRKCEIRSFMAKGRDTATKTLPFFCEVATIYYCSTVPYRTIRVLLYFVFSSFRAAHTNYVWTRTITTVW